MNGFPQQNQKTQQPQPVAPCFPPLIKAFIHQVRINAVIGSKYECWESKEMLTRFSTEKITPFICLLQVNEKKC